jgi:hypothetical protein
MTKSETITIEDQVYDALTGLPVSASTPSSSIKVTVSSHKQLSTATTLHGGPQRSVTLQRKFLKKPVPLKHQIVKHASAKHMDIARPAQTAQRNGTIRRFAPHPAGALAAPQAPVDIAPVAHPHVVKAHARSATAVSPVRASNASELKENVIRNAIANTHKKPALKDRLRVKQRTAGIVGATFALVLLAGYFTYLNMPALSVRVAAAQAGIDASYPNYRPDGYALNGPVTYSDGKVAMNFKANGSNDAFTVSQSKSGWDSAALLNNYVSPKAGSDYIPYTERGLTIYTYGDNAAWVNGGILYTIEGDAPLSSSQMRRIATSLL